MMGSILIILAGFRLFVLPVHGFQEFNYHYVNKTMNWANAQAFCQSNFIDLVAIADKEENEEIMKMLSENNVSNAEIWIGLKDINITNGTWSNGETFTYRNWRNGEPNNEAVACGTIYYKHVLYKPDGSWNDCGCSYSQPFICYSVKRKFHAVNTSMSWLSALEYCNSNSNYSGMATIRNETEEWHLLQYLNETKIREKVWIGMRRSRVFGFWFWMNDDPVTYENWVNDSSETIQDNCATLDPNQKKWVKQDCAQPALFVCNRVKWIM